METCNVEECVGRRQSRTQGSFIKSLHKENLVMERLAITGTSFEIGAALGRTARPLARRIASAVRRNAFCCRLRATEMTSLMQKVQERFPHLWEELRGISAGLDLDIEDVFLWNFLQDRLDTSASGSVVINRLGYRLLLNKRELGPTFGGKCKVIEVHPEGKPGYVSLYVPGCMPGTTFAANRAGVAHAVDPVPDESSVTGLPGFIVSRAVLDAGSLAEAIDIVMECDRYDSAHHILASTQEFVTVTIAATPSERKLAPIPNRHWHTNHFVGKTSQEEAACRLSMARYAALSGLMEKLPDHPTEEDILSLLESKADPDVDAGAIQPTKGDIGTAVIKLCPGRIEMRLFRAADPIKHRYIVKVLPDKNQGADTA